MLTEGGPTPNRALHVCVSTCDGSPTKRCRAPCDVASPQAIPVDLWRRPENRERACSSGRGGRERNARPGRAGRVYDGGERDLESWTKRLRRNDQEARNRGRVVTGAAICIAGSSCVLWIQSRRGGPWLALLGNDFLRAGPAWRCGPDRGANRLAAFSTQRQADDFSLPVRRAFAMELFHYKRHSRSQGARNCRFHPQRPTHYRDDFGQTSLPVVPTIFKFAQQGRAGRGSASCCRTPPGSPTSWRRQDDEDRGDQPRPAVTFCQTGSQLAGRPSMGAWVANGLGKPEPGFACIYRLGLPAPAILTTSPFTIACGAAAFCRPGFKE